MEKEKERKEKERKEKERKEKEGTYHVSQLNRDPN